MFIFGHTGIGSSLIPRRWPFFPVILGTLLPDIIDKPLFYFWYWWQDWDVSSLGLITGTRTFGHVLLFWILLFLVERKRNRLGGQAVALGAMTHLALDVLSETIRGTDIRPLVHGVFFPFFDLAFPIYPFRDTWEHIERYKSLHLIGAEVLGAILLARSYLQGRWQVRRFF